MRSMKAPFIAVGLSAAVSLHGCVSPGQAPVAPIDTRPTLRSPLAASIPFYTLGPQQRDRGSSRLNPNAKAIKELLYVSDHHTDDVYVYNFKSGAILGKLTGFHDPYGQCVDSNGDIWIANFSGHSIVEYEHGGTSPIRTLMTDGHAIGCSVAPQGDLSVANMSTSDGSGDVEVWENASGSPSSYANAQSCYYLWPPGDDTYGNTFVETTASTYVCELYYGGSQGLMYGNSIFGDYKDTINFPGSSMWDGEYLTFTDQEYGGGHSTAIYQTIEMVSGGLIVTGTTVLKDGCHGSDVDIVQPFVVGTANTPVNKKQGSVIIGGNLSCSHRFDYWSYPAGGDPIKSLKGAPQEPMGASVSIAAAKK